MNVDKAWDALNLDPQFKFYGEETLGTENGGNWNSVAMQPLMIKDLVLPTFSDVHLLTNISHWEIITKEFKDAVKCT